LLEHVPDLRVPQFAAVPRFPGSSRDLSLDAAIALPVERIVSARIGAEAATIRAGEDPPRLVPGELGRGAVELVEDYRAQGIAEGRRALLLRMHYGCRTRSVTDTEVQQTHEAIVEAAIVQLRAQDGHLRRR
ncbi:MAG: hypothetical protein JNK45_34890, partial [Myxococcales bacterium]|nr:hypothetical protein [Myxococcales bacterium]